MFLDDAAKRDSVVSTKDFQLFTESATRAFSDYSLLQFIHADDPGGDKPHFFASTSADGTYVYLAATQAVFAKYGAVVEGSSEPTDKTYGGHRYLIFEVPEKPWSLAEMLQHVQLHAPAPQLQVHRSNAKEEEPTGAADNLLKSLQADFVTYIVFDEIFLDVKTQPRELLVNNEITVFNEAPPPGSYVASKILRKTSQSQWYARLRGCCFYGPRPPDFPAFNELAKTKLNQRKVHLVNFFENTFAKATVGKLARSSGKNSMTNPSFFENDTLSKLNNVFSRSTGEVVLISGHVEGKNQDRFVAYDANTVEIFRVHIRELQELADRHHVSIILLGCTTYPAIRGDSKNVVGTVEEISTRRAMQQLDKALTTANNWGEFFERLAAPDMIMVATKHMADFDSQQQHFGLTADVLKTKPLKHSLRRYQLVGLLQISFQCSFLGHAGQC